MLQRSLKSWVLAGLLVAGMAGSPLPAPPVDPPSKVLQSARTQVVTGRFASRLPDGRYRFTEISAVRGPDEAPAEVLVRGPDWLATWLSPGHRYLFAYTAYLRNPRFRKEMLVDTDGPRLVDWPGLEPALFMDSEGLSATLLHPLDRDTLQSPEFLDRLISVAIPRIRDFRGISGKGFDGRGNYNVGVKEQIIFPEIEYDKIDALRGMNISITTTAKNDDEAKALLAAFKFPFKN